jgi:hypothetical protein
VRNYAAASQRFWLGFLLLTTIVLQLLQRERLFGGLLLLTVFGFTLTMGAVNVDGLIVEQNAVIARSGKELDSAYLLSLSDDALPALMREFSRPEQPEVVREPLGVVLSCWRYNAAQQLPRPWQSFHPGSALAMQALQSVELRNFAVHAEQKRNPYINFSGGKFRCRSYSIAD